MCIAILLAKPATKAVQCMVVPSNSWISHVQQSFWMQMQQLFSVILIDTRSGNGAIRLQFAIDFFSLLLSVLRGISIAFQV